MLVFSESNNRSCFGINESGMFKKTRLNGYPFNSNLITDHYSSSSNLNPYKNTLLLQPCPHQHPMIKAEDEPEIKEEEEQLEPESMRYVMNGSNGVVIEPSPQPPQTNSHPSGRFIGEDVCWHPKTNHNSTKIEDIHNGIISQNLHNNNKRIMTDRGLNSTFKRKRLSKKNSDLNINNTQSQSSQSEQSLQPQQRQQQPQQRRKHKQHKPWLIK